MQPSTSKTILQHSPAPAAPTCEGEGCMFNGPEYYFRNGVRLCGPCMDKADDADMPYLTSEFSYELLKRLDD